MDKQLQKDVEDLKKDINKFREDLSGTLSDAGSLSQEKIMETKERLKNATAAFEGVATEKLGKAKDVVQEKGEHAVEASREMITNRPLTTVLVSFAAGLLTAFILEKSRK